MKKENEHKPGAGGQTGGHIGKTDQKRKDPSEPLKVNQGGYYSEEGEGENPKTGSPRQDVNNRITGTNPYTGRNEPQNEEQRNAARKSSEYGTEGNENGSGTGNRQ